MQRDIRCRLLLVCVSLVGHITKLGRLFGYKHAFGRVIHEDNSRNQESDIYVQNVLKLPATYYGDIFGPLLITTD